MKKLKHSYLLATLMLFSIGYAQAQATRTEKDLLGAKQIPANAYYGVHTMRAAFQRKAEEFGDILKIGRTQGQRTRSGRA